MAPHPPVGRAAPRPTRGRWRLALPTLLLGLAACSTPPPAPGLVELLQQPAERQLAAGLAAYDAARYADAEARLLESLKLGLQRPVDRAAAHKTLAFLYCTSQRMAACAAAFVAARGADPRFALTRAEAGHPLWGPVYRDALP